jgi:hypothetical protein
VKTGVLTSQACFYIERHTRNTCGTAAETEIAMSTLQTLPIATDTSLIYSGNKKVLADRIVQGCATVYLYEVDGMPCARAYKGKSNKSEFHHRYTNEEARTNHVAEFLKRCGVLDEYKAKRKAEAAACSAATDLPVGTILCESWGYDQTNVSFYKVGHVGKKTVKLVAVTPKSVESYPRIGAMSDMCVPDLDNCATEVQLMRQISKESVKNTKLNKRASVWSGKPLYRSWYA